ncbi:MAG: restriction endonuclease subunit S [gamma proteobacterium endosymbiont of Lamellibrachia anaximandri]|nr:restriction endonuclease subunit S [gamma proteobacterium endosymbiont of Lamellibrachia anaximandri]MBL3533787.1 restriction endonuclease subunit S [gamma proteobacterium endosymbiont of Lamellibrachia anaximandri]
MASDTPIDITPRQRKELLTLFNRYLPDTEVWAYGSRVKWTSRQDSDLDLVAFSKPDQRTQVSLLREAFEESNLPFRVDFFVWDEIPEQFKKNIEAEHVVFQEKIEQRLTVGWTECMLENCMAAIIDYRGKTPKKRTSGIPLITAKIIKKGTILPVTEFIAEEDYDSWMRRGIPELGDIVMTTEAPLGEVAQLDGRKVALAQRVITLRGKPKLLDNTFLKYLMASQFVQHQLDGRGTGTTVNGIKQSELRRITLKFPSFLEQKSIAHILGTLDDKIELNRQMNATLEAMAQALFKSWFVDFDPVIDNALAAGHPIPEPLHARAEARKALGDKRKPLPEAIQKQFPSRFVFNEEMGWVPEGWECMQWGSFAKLEYGKSLKGYREGEGSVPVFGTNGKVGLTGKALCDKEGIIIGRKGAYRGVHYSETPFYVIDTAFFLSPLVSLSVKWAYYEILRFDINGMDSGSAIPSTSRDDFYSLWSVFPKIGIQDEFDRLISMIYEKKLFNDSGNTSLSLIRDTLLPKLLSGQLRIPDAEKLIKAI